MASYHQTTWKKEKAMTQTTPLSRAKQTIASLSKVRAEFVFAENGENPIRFTLADLQYLIDRVEKMEAFIQVTDLMNKMKDNEALKET